MKERKLTEEEKRRRIKNLIISGLVISIGCIIGVLVNSNTKLTNENKNLDRQNSKLRGRIKSLKDENKRLVKENYEACYHLGKKSVTHPRRVIKIKK